MKTKLVVESVLKSGCDKVAQIVERAPRLFSGRRRGALTLALVGLGVCLLIISHELAVTQLRECDAQIAKASPWVRPYLVMSSPVEDWERNLYETRALSQTQLGDELSKRLEVSFEARDIGAWSERMKADACLLELFGLWFYVPNVGLFRSLYRIYGEYAILVGASVYATYHAYLKHLLQLSRRKVNSHVIGIKKHETQKFTSAILRRHCLNIAIIVTVALITFNCYIADPANNVANGLDIREGGLDFYDWFLRSSILERGTIPLWLRSRTGSVYVGDPQTSTYYISTVISILSSNEQLSIRYNIVLHVIMSGIFMYILLNIWGQRPEASTFGGIGYMLSGFFIARVFAGHLPMIYAYPWTPLVLASFELAYRRDSVKYAMLTGLSLSMQILCGGFLIFLSAGLLLGVYTAHKVLVRLIASIGHPKALPAHISQIAKLLMIVAVFALGIAAIKVLPVIEEFPLTNRGMTPFTPSAVLKERVSSWSQLQELFVSDSKTSPLSKGDWWECRSYLGTFTIILAALGALLVRRDLTAPFLVFSTVLSVSLARGILIAPLIYLLPFFGLTDLPSRFLVITQLTIPALATMTITAIEKYLEDLIQRKQRKLAINRLKYFGKPVAYGLVFLLIMDLVPVSENFMWTFPVEQPIALSESNEIYRVYPNPTRLSATLTSLGYARNGLEVTGRWGWEFAIQAYTKYLGAAESGAYKVLGPLNVKYVLSDSEMYDSSLKLERMLPNNMYAYLNMFYMGRLWIAYRAILVISDDSAFWESEAIGLLKNPSFNPQRTLLVRGEFVDDFTVDTLRRFDVVYLPSNTSPPARSQLKAEELLTRYLDSGGTIVEIDQTIPSSVWERLNSEDMPPQPRITDYQPNWLEASVTLEKPAFLFISEVLVPGWHLYVNSREVPIYQMDDIFFGTMLEEGEYSLRVEFNPLSYRIGSVVTGVALIALVSLIALDSWKRYCRSKPVPIVAEG